MYDILALLGGFALLIVGGELLVRGAVKAAAVLGMSPLLIGLTLVGFGTSTPELVTSVQAALVGSPGIAIGNIVGSNIANILLILGATALISPILVSAAALRRDGSVVVVSAVIFAALAFLLPLDRPVGLALIAGLVAYLYYAYIQESAAQVSDHTAVFDKAAALDEIHGDQLVDGLDGRRQSPLRALALPIVLFLVGLVIIVFGGRLLVMGATALARDVGIAETVIGLTIVAVGTSLPELVTSLVAAIRKHGDVALGNILGSNIYNVLGIGGVTAIISPTRVPDDIVRFDNFVMIAVSLTMVLFARTGYRLGRAEGAVLVGGYCVYIVMLIMR